MSERQGFEEWCGITITDESKAPKAAALKKAYWHAWQASRKATAEEIADWLDGLIESYEETGDVEPAAVLRAFLIPLRARYEIEREFVKE